MVDASKTFPGDSGIASSPLAEPVIPFLFPHIPHIQAWFPAPSLPYQSSAAHILVGSPSVLSLLFKKNIYTPLSPGSCPASPPPPHPLDRTAPTNGVANLPPSDSPSSTPPASLSPCHHPAKTESPVGKIICDMILDKLDLNSCQVPNASPSPET
jgi:hypothetical protein